MPICVQCRTEVGFLGSLSFNKQTGRCSKCDGETKQALMRFRTAFLNFCSDGTLTAEKWAGLSAGAAHDRLNINEAQVFIRGDVLNLLDRLLTFATANGYITEAEEHNFHYSRTMLAIPDAIAQPLLNRLAHLSYVTNIRRGTLPTARPSIRLETDELCHMEIPATYHKINAKSTSLVSG